VAGGGMNGRSRGRIAGVGPRTAVGALLAAVLWPAPGGAHLVTTGLGPFYDGISHLALTPEDLLPVIALALLAGQGGARHGRWALFVLPGAWLLGGLAGLAAPAGIGTALTAVSFLVLGGLVAADPRLPSPATTALAAALGLFHGFLNGAGPVGPEAAGPGGLELLGIAVTVFAVVALAAALVVSLRAPWTRIAVRVAGSWIAATGLLMLGWALRGGA